MSVHTNLTDGDYRITADSGIDIDTETSLCTRSQSAVFRGSLQSLYSAFTFGAQTNSPDGQSRLFSAGPRSVRMVPGTDSDPHWAFDVEFVGMHSYVHSSSYAVWRVSPFWGVRETTLPITNSDASLTIVALSPYLPSGANANSPVTIHDYLPGVNVRGIMFTNQHPHPAHPQITTLVSTIPSIITPAMITQNTVNYSALTVSGYNWCKGIAAGSNTSNNTVGKWFVGDISADRVFEPMDGSTANKIYVVQFAVRWLPRKVPA